MKNDKILTWSTKKIANGVFLANVIEIIPLDAPRINNGREIWADTKVIVSNTIKGNRAKASNYAKRCVNYLRNS